MQILLGAYPPGAVAATDLVTTSPTVRVTGDTLPDQDALAEFLVRHDIRLDALADGQPLTGDDVFRVHLLRREVRGIIETENADQAVAGAAVLVRRAGLGPVLRQDGDGDWQWHVPTAPGASVADELAAFVGVALLGVVRALGHERFRACAAPGCRGVFVDASRTGRRRYCMPELCGNRVNVASFRARQRERSVSR